MQPGGSVQVMGGVSTGCVSIEGGGDLVIDQVHTWLCWLWLRGAGI